MFQLELQSDEYFKPVVGYEDSYEVSNYGNIASLNYRRTGKRKLLSLCKNAKGYVVAILAKEGKSKTYLAHRLMAEAFLPNPDNKDQIDHRNGIRDDNHINNVRWVTNEENHNFDMARENHSKSKMGNSNALKTNSMRQIHKRAREAGEFTQSAFTFRQAYNDPNHKKHELVLNLTKKYTI